MKESQYPSIDAETFVRWGKEAAQAGNKERAYRCFSQALRLKPEDEEIWLWKGAMAPTAEESLECMRKALALNPNSRRAWEGLEWAAERLAKARGQKPEELFGEEVPIQPEPHEPETESPAPPEPEPRFVEAEAQPQPSLPAEPLFRLNRWQLVLIALLVLAVIMLVVKARVL